MIVPDGSNIETRWLTVVAALKHRDICYWHAIHCHDIQLILCIGYIIHLNQVHNSKNSGLRHHCNHPRISGSFPSHSWIKPAGGRLNAGDFSLYTIHTRVEAPSLIQNVTQAKSRAGTPA